MVFHWSLSDSKSPQISRTFLSILVNLNNAVIWMVPTRPFIYKSFGTFTNHLVTVLTTPITIISLSLSCFIVFSASSRYLSLFSLSFSFILSKLPNMLLLLVWYNHNLLWKNIISRCRYFEALNRKNYVTPTSFLELIRTFKSLLNKKRMEILTLKNRYVVGLEKLEFSKTQVVFRIIFQLNFFSLFNCESSMHYIRSLTIQIFVTFRRHADWNNLPIWATIIMLY